MINQQKIKKWVEIYLAHIKEITLEVHVQDEEGYKFKAVDNFQLNFDLESKDLVSMLENAIVNNNLVAGSWYFPRKMLLIFAQEHEKETRSALEYLFDLSKPTSERINHVQTVFEKLMEDRNKKLGEDSHSFIGIRFLSLLLGYRYPDLENALKPREWRAYSSFVDEDFSIPNGTSSGEQYEIFRSYVEEMRKYIQTIPQVDELRVKLTKGLDFKDEEFRWMAQDVIYVTSRQIVKETGNDEPEVVVPKEEENLDEEGGTPATVDDKFYYEDDLENFVLENLDKLGLDDDLKLYTDSKGVQGQQYPVDGGYIDLLLTDKSENFVIIELKRDRAKADVIGQILGYINWVEENLAKGKKVRGIVICGRGNLNLLSAVRALGGKVEVRYYNLKLDLINPQK